MTYDRAIYVAKMFSYDIRGVANLDSFEIVDESKIDPELVILSNERVIKNIIQSSLSAISLMPYGSEKGWEYIFSSANSTKSIIFRLLVVGDHLYGINIRFINCKQDEQKQIIDALKKVFARIEIYLF